MAYFPLCMRLDGADIVLVGGGRHAEEKLRVLLPFGAVIRLYAEDRFPEWDDHPQLQRMDRAFSEAELDDRPAFVVVADLPHAEKEQISALCMARHIPVNVIDVPDLCSFYFPALCTRGALTVAVSTAGKSPAAAAHLRRQFEQQLPDETEAIIDWLADFREGLKATHSAAERRQLLRQAAAQALALGRPLTDGETQKLLRDLA